LAVGGVETESNTHFVDYYELMQISPNAELDTVQRVFRMLVTRYHPDNPHTGNLNKFLRLRQAYETLSDPLKRASYDTSYSCRNVEPLPIFELKEFTVGLEGEPNRRMGGLCLLYHRRRTNPELPGLSILDLEQMMGFPREHLMFTAWCLLEKQYVKTMGNSDLVITAEGIDYIEKNMARSGVIKSLLTSAENGGSHSRDEAGSDALTPDILKANQEPMACNLGLVI
jgi:curved DNA-binding protein